MQQELVFTKKIAKSGRGYLVWIPKDVSDFLSFSKESMVEFKVSKLFLDKAPSEELIFTKRIAKSGKGYLVWIPMDVISFLKLDENSVLEIKVKLLSKGDEP